MSVPLRARLFAAGFVALWIQAASVQAMEPYPNVYRVWLEAGGLFPQSTELHLSPGSGGSSKLTLDPGVRIGIGTDYSFTRYLSVGWEVAVLGSSVDKAAAFEEMDALITQVPFLINVAVRYENETGFTPFIGVGAGAASTAINVDEARTGTSTLEGSDYDFGFAWQLVGGLKYEFKRGLALGVLYKYLWTSDAEWEIEDQFIGGDRQLELDGIRSHAILAFVSYRF